MSQPKVVIYTATHCPYCQAAKMLLEQKGVHYELINLDSANPDLRDEVVRSSGQRTLPQIFINSKSIGGFDDLRALNQTGELDELLQLQQQDDH